MLIACILLHGQRKKSIDFSYTVGLCHQSACGSDIISVAITCIVRVYECWLLSRKKKTKTNKKRKIAAPERIKLPNRGRSPGCFMGAIAAHKHLLHVYKVTYYITRSVFIPGLSSTAVLYYCLEFTETVRFVLYREILCCCSLLLFIYIYIDFFSPTWVCIIVLCLFVPIFSFVVLVFSCMYIYTVLLILELCVTLREMKNFLYVYTHMANKADSDLRAILSQLIAALLKNCP